MQPLSLPLAEWLPPPQQQRKVDAVVIGSGYGGSVAALRLAEQGRQVVLLERGSEFLPGEFANDVGQLPKYLRAQTPFGPLGSASGLFEWRAGPGLVSLVANGLGGGSLINAGVMMKPDADVFAQPYWPAQIRHALDARADGGVYGLDAAFERAAQVLGGEVFRDPGSDPAAAEVSSLPKAQALQRLAKRIDARAEPARVTIDLSRCTRCGDCFTGCNVEDAKRTLCTSYLRQAVAAGVQIVTRCLVYSIAPEFDGAANRSAHDSADLEPRGWLLRVLATEASNHARSLADAVELKGQTLHAQLVVVAAGTFGSTELLMRSRQRSGGSFSLSPALGSRLSGNGDHLCVLADERAPVGGLGHGAETLAGRQQVGPTITTLIDLRKKKAALEDRLVIQEGAAPGALVRVYQELLAATWVLRHIGERWRAPRCAKDAEPLAASQALARHTQMLLSMGHDGSRGRIEWMPAADAVAPRWTRPHELRTHVAQHELFRAVQRKGLRGDGVHMDTPLWRVLPERVAELADRPGAEPTLLTVHPLGGCPMSDSYERGVVDHLGQVWRRPCKLWPGLYVLDGSIVPTSLGCNPMWTIAALSERAMAYLGRAPKPGLAHAPVASRTSPPRDPLALSRHAAPKYDAVATERLEKQELPLRGALRRAFDRPHVECDLRVLMRHADWVAVWDDPKHGFTDVSGALRLVDPAQPGQRRVEYAITSGHVDLLAQERVWPGVQVLRRFWRCFRVAATWLIVRRGGADFSTFPWSWRSACTLWHLIWQAAEVRHVRYDLRLELQKQRGVVDPPRALRVSGGKWIGYAATWPEVVRHLWVRWRQRALPQDHEHKRRPGDLRASVLHQLTQPTLTIAPPGRLRQLLPAWLGRHSKARFDFDQRDALQRVPLHLAGDDGAGDARSGDSAGAVLALLAYPALILRQLVLSRLLEFRLPNYSRTPLLDAASAEDVALQVRIGAAKVTLAPEEEILRVRRGRSSSDDGSEAVGRLELRLWRYRRIDPGNLAAAPPELSRGTWCGHDVVRAKSVLLMHAFGMSGYSFTFKGTTKNYAEHLCEQGWEVWILDSRMSTRTSAHMEPATLDQLGAIDVPQAVEHILAKLRGELALPADPPLQISCFAQCVGSIGVLIALLSGSLSYPRRAHPQFAAATGRAPLMPKLAALVSSQTHPFIVGSRSSQSKTWVPAALRNLAGRKLVALAVRRPADTLVEATLDRVFAALPVPDGERCPAEGERWREHDDDCTTCRRIRFLDAELFKHRNLNEATHRELPKLFGDANVRLFAHAAKFIGYERLTSEDGFNVYATEEAIGLHLALPIRFMHGALNQLFDKESALRSAEEYAHIHPGWVQAYGKPYQGKPAVFDVIEGYGHLDPLIGFKAMQSEGGKPSVYDRLTDLLTQAFRAGEALPAPAAAVRPALRMAFPKAGPWIGPVVSAGARRHVAVAFVVDDGGAEATHTVGLGASAIVGEGVRRRRVALQIVEYPVPTPARDGFDPAATIDAQSIGMRVARGAIRIDDNANVRIECVSHSHCGPAPPQPAAPVKGGGRAQRAQARRLSRRSQAPRGPRLGIDELWQAVEKARQEASKQRSETNRPFPQTLSQQRIRPANGLHSVLELDRRVVGDVAPGDAVRVALGCCRYGAFGIDRERADESFRRLMTRERLDGAQPPVDLLLMLGDQIYADASAGAVDPLSPFERYVHRHQQAFTSAGLRALCTRLPVVCLPDDHEFSDSYPLGRPLFRPTAGRAGYARVREAFAQRCATQAVLAYQTMQLPRPMARRGWCSFERGAVRFFALDTRRWRRMGAKGAVTTLPPRALQALEHWLGKGPADALNCVLTASPLVPGLVRGSNPANPGPPDTIEASPEERSALLDLLVRTSRGRFVLIAGDHHLSWAGDVQLDGATVGAAIVAPPFYAPFPFVNSAPHEIALNESIDLPRGGTITLAPTKSDSLLRGSGYGVLELQRNGAAWRIQLHTESKDFECATGWQTKRWPAIDLPVCRPQVVPESSPMTATVA